MLCERLWINDNSFGKQCLSLKPVLSRLTDQHPVAFSVLTMLNWRQKEYVIRPVRN